MTLSVADSVPGGFEPHVPVRDGSLRTDPGLDGLVRDGSLPDRSRPDGIVPDDLMLDGSVLPGSGPAGSGFGLAGIAERVASCGGNLTVGPTATGFALTARLPVR